MLKIKLTTNKTKLNFDAYQGPLMETRQNKYLDDLIWWAVWLSFFCCFRQLAQNMSEYTCVFSIRPSAQKLSGLIPVFIVFGN